MTVEVFYSGVLNNQYYCIIIAVSKGFLSSIVISIALKETYLSEDAFFYI